MKSYTDINQSKVLTTILPLESADMIYPHFIRMGADTYDVIPVVVEVGDVDYPYDHPCWSLAALLGVLAKIASKIDDDGSAALSSFMGQWSVNMFDCPVEATDNYDNPIDACYNMIIKLNELKML